MLASVDAVEALEAALAARSAKEPVLAQPPPAGLMSPAVQGMILLNISAALFGSNQVRNSLSLFSKEAAAAAAAAAPLSARDIKGSGEIHTSSFAWSGVEPACSNHWAGDQPHFGVLLI